MNKQTSLKAAALSAALAGVLSSSGTAQTMLHRYSFSDPAGSGTFNDSVGTAHGTLVNAPDAQLDGTQLQLSGFGGFGSLPSGLISSQSSVTIEFWASLSDLNPVWTRVWSFGSQNGLGQKDTGMDYCHYAGGNWQNLGLTTPTGNVWANNPGGLNGQTNVHVTCVIDPAGNQMFYYNGSSVRSNPGVNGGTIPALSTLVDTYGLIGKSLYDVDATLTGSIDEFRVYSGVLSRPQVALNDASGPDNYVTSPGTLASVSLQSPDNPLTVSQISRQTFKGNFSAVTGLDLVAYGGATFLSLNPAVLTVTTEGVVTAVSPGTASLVASYGGMSVTNSLTVVSVPAVLKHRYSFAADATDSVSGANGTLQGAATIASGKVVLDGTSGTYVDLPGPTIDVPKYKAITIQAWVDFGDVPTWSRLWDFGADGGSHEIYFAPRVLAGGEHWASQNISGGVTTAFNGTLSNQTAQITVVMDPPSGLMAIYKNGVLEHARYDGLAPPSRVTNALAVLGRSLVPADAYMPGSIDEFRIYEGALTAQEVALTHANGVASTTRDPGALSSIQFSSLSYPAYSRRIAPAISANYANLTGFNLVPNTTVRVQGLTVTSSDTNIIAVLANNMLRTFRPGQVTLTANYLGKTATALVTVENRGQLTHRYSFAADANDSVGTAHGALQGTASVAGGKLVLDGASGSYLSLPAGLLKGYDAVTIDAWVDFGPGANWARLFHFGNNTEHEFYMAPRTGGGAHRLSAGFFVDGTTRDISGPWENMSLHLTAIYGNGTIALYTNGVLHDLATANGRTEQIGTWVSWIGRSPHPDPYMNCSVDEFRVYNGKLSQEEVAASQALGPNALLSTAAPTLSASAAAGNVTLSWPSAAAGFTLQAKPSLTGSWQIITNAPSLSGANWQLTLPASSSSQFFRLWR